MDVVFHHAALASVPRSVADPLETHAADATGTVTLLEAARQAGVRRVVYAASSSCYGNRPEMPKEESHLPQVLSPYAAAKLAGELYCEAFAACFPLETVRLRYFNVFGPRQDPQGPYAAVIPLFVTALLEGRRPTIFGDGSQSRDFTYVDNVVDANLLAASVAGISGRVYNVACGHSTSVLELLKQMCACWKNRSTRFSLRLARATSSIRRPTSPLQCAISATSPRSIRWKGCVEQSAGMPNTKHSPPGRSSAVHRERTNRKSGTHEGLSDGLGCYPDRGTGQFHDDDHAADDPASRLAARRHAISGTLGRRGGDEQGPGGGPRNRYGADLRVAQVRQLVVHGLRQQAKTVFQALSLLGRRQSRMLVMATGARPPCARKSKLINQQAFWNACLQKALFAQIAQMLQTDADVAFSGALLQDYLLPVLTNDLIDTYLEFVQQRETFPETLCEFEHNRFNRITPWRERAWRSVEPARRAGLLHSVPSQRPAILAHPQLGRSPVAAVALSAMLPDQLRQHYHGLELLSNLEQKWPAFRLEALATTVDQQHEAMNLGVRNDFPLSRRCKCLAGAAEAYDDGSLETVTAA